MTDFPKSLKDGDIELVKLTPTFENTQKVFDVIYKNRDFLGKWLPWVKNVKKPENQFAHVQEVACDDFPGYFILFKDQVVGDISFVNFSESQKKAELGFWLDRDVNGRGIMSRAVKMMEKLAFEKYAIVRLEIGSDAENIPSQNVATRLGYEKEGLLRKAYMLHDELRDLVIFAKIKAGK